MCPKKPKALKLLLHNLPPRAAQACNRDCPLAPAALLRAFHLPCCIGAALTLITRTRNPRLGDQAPLGAAGVFCRSIPDRGRRGKLRIDAHLFEIAKKSISRTPRSIHGLRRGIVEPGQERTGGDAAQVVVPAFRDLAHQIGARLGREPDCCGTERTARCTSVFGIIRESVFQSRRRWRSVGLAGLGRLSMRLGRIPDQKKWPTTRLQTPHRTWQTTPAETYSLARTHRAAPARRRFSRRWARRWSSASPICAKTCAHRSCAMSSGKRISFGGSSLPESCAVFEA